MTSESTHTPSRKKLLAGQIAGAALGIAASTYSGMNLLVPGVAAVAILFAGTKLWRPSEPHYLGAIAVQGAHLVWLLVGTALVGAWGANLIDVIVLGAGVAWLWFRPSIWPVLLLTVFQVLALAFNTLVILQHPVGNMEHRALAVHIMLRIVAVASMWYAYAHIKRGRGDA
jgi:hypothetical protein